MGDVEKTETLKPTEKEAMETEVKNILASIGKKEEPKEEPKKEIKKESEEETAVLDEDAEEDSGIDIKKVADEMPAKLTPRQIAEAAAIGISYSEAKEIGPDELENIIYEHRQIKAENTKPETKEQEKPKDGIDFEALRKDYEDPLIDTMESIYKENKALREELNSMKSSKQHDVKAEFDAELHSQKEWKMFIGTPETKTAEQKKYTKEIAVQTAALLSGYRFLGMVEPPMREVVNKAARIVFFDKQKEIVSEELRKKIEKRSSQMTNKPKSTGNDGGNNTASKLYDEVDRILNRGSGTAGL